MRKPIIRHFERNKDERFNEFITRAIRFFRNLKDKGIEVKIYPKYSNDKQITYSVKGGKE